MAKSELTEAGERYYHEHYSDPAEPPDHHNNVDPYADVPRPPEPPDETTGNPADSADDYAPPVYADRILARSALRDLPDPQPLISNVIDQGTVALLYGKWGTGKSFIAQDWAASVATSRPWQGRATEQRRVLYIAAEGAFGLKGRTRSLGNRLAPAHRRRHPRHTARTSQPHPHHRRRQPRRPHHLERLRLRHPRHPRPLHGRRRRKLGERLRPRRRHAPPATPTNTRRPRRHPRRPPRRERRQNIPRLHHVRSRRRHRLRRQPRRDGHHPRRQKRKDGPIVDRHELKLGPIEGTGSCIIESAVRPRETTERADALLAHFVSHFADIGATRADLRDSVDLPRATFYRALNDLVKSGELINEGTPRRPFYRAVQCTLFVPGQRRRVACDTPTVVSLGGETA